MASRRADTRTTREKVADLRARDPEVTAAEMARTLGITRQAVHHHLDALELPTSTSRSDRAKGSAVDGTARTKISTALRKIDDAVRELQDARAALAELAGVPARKRRKR